MSASIRLLFNEAFSGGEGTDGGLAFRAGLLTDTETVMIVIAEHV